MLNTKFKLLYFDDKQIVKKMDAEQRKILISAGAQIRTRAMRSMRPARRLRKSEITPQIAEEQLGLPRETDLTKIRSRLGFKLPYKASAPGEAPRTRQSKQLKRRMRFGYDPTNRSIVVGPQQYGTNAAKILEEGGTATIEIRTPQRQISRSTPAQREGLRKARASGKLRTRKRPSKILKSKKNIKIKARPFLRPPFQIVYPKIANQFRGVIR